VLQPLADIHLYSDLIQEARVNGNGRTVYFLLIIALFILVIAWVNYINLSTARAIERAKEVGVRKAIGAAKRQLVGQFLSEALMINFFAALIGLFLVAIAIPLFNEIAGKHLTFSIFSDPNLWLALAALFLLGTMLSGVYPAFVLSSFQPVKVLKGSLKGTRDGLFLRKALVTIQFVFSVALITGTIIVYRQLQYMTKQDLGIDIEQTVVINGPGYLQADSLYTTYLNGFRNAVNNQSVIKNFTVTTEVPGNLIFWTTGALRMGDDVTKRNQMYIMGVDNNFFQTFGNKFLSGRPYSPEFTGDSSSVILNRKAVEMFNLASPENAIGQRIAIGRDTLNIVGVVENYHQEGLRQDFRPTAFRLVQSARSYFCVKVNSKDLDDALTLLKSQYATIFPNNPFDYFFLDSFFNRQYQNERQFGSVFSFFSLLAIFVASLGLFGLASFTAAQRTKEIGIRKVLGSSVPNIFLLLSKDFIKLVIIANLIAVPLVWFVMEKWLNTFAFRIDMSLWFFAVAAVITILVALFTVSYQSVNAAVANPVKSLRYE
jgi:putative ABC transport system permease protein